MTLGAQISLGVGYSESTRVFIMVKRDRSTHPTLTYTDPIVVAMPLAILSASLDKCPRGSVAFNKNERKHSLRHNFPSTFQVG